MAEPCSAWCPRCCGRADRAGQAEPDHPRDALAADRASRWSGAGRDRAGQQGRREISRHLWRGEQRPVLDQHQTIGMLDQQRAHPEGDPVLLVRRDPLRPQRLGHHAEGSSLAIEAQGAALEEVDAQEPRVIDWLRDMGERRKGKGEGKRPCLLTANG